MFVYREFAPSSALAPFVRCFWTLSGEGPASTERILPDGAFELVFHFGAPFRANGVEQPRAMFVGELRRPTIITSSHAAEVLGVRFRAGGAAPFFRHAMSACSDLMLPAAEVFAEWERVLEAAPAIRVPLLEQLLIDSCRVPRSAATAGAVVRTVEAHRGNIRIRDAASVCGLSERAIERAFEQCVGVTAKTYARLVRFHAYLAAPAADHGYVDDAHLAHEFRGFAGVSAGEFRSEQNAINAAFRGS